jgi:hypothetical protein
VFLDDGEAWVNYTKVQVKQGGTMRVDALLDMLQRVGFVGMVLSVFIRQHDETFMVINASQGAEIERRLVAGIKMGKANEQRVERRTESDISAVLTSLQAQGLPKMGDMGVGQ